MQNGKCIAVAVFFLLIAASVFVAPASAAVSGANLKVTIIDISPYPAEIGQYVTLTAQVENVGRERAEDVSIKLVPDYPFSLDSPGNAVQNIGALSPEKIATKEFNLFVDKAAQKGVRSIDIRTQAEKNAPWSEESFDLRIGTETFDSKGTVELEQIVSDPEVFMPGDRGTVTLTLRNTADTPTITIDGRDYDTNARIQSALLTSSEEGLTVTSAPYEEMGIMGPGDKLDLTFNVKVAEEAEDGTYHLELALEGNSFDYNSRKNIPLEVDPSNVKVIPSKPLKLVNGKATLEFDVANTHPNEFNSVSIKPEAEGVEFYPAEYFIGPMDPDELFTIEFDAAVEQTGTGDEALSENEPINMTLVASYSNGINQHENSVSNLQLTRITPVQEGGSKNILVGLGLLLLLVVGGLVYRKKKQGGM